MKSKDQKYQEAIVRNSQHRGKHLSAGQKMGLEGDDLQAYADYKTGVRNKANKNVHVKW